MNTNEKKRFIGIVCFIMSVASVFLLFDLYVRSGPSADRPGSDTSVETGESTEPIRTEAGPMISPDEATWALEDKEGNRSIMEFLDRRVYPGAPPEIPHDVDENALNDPDCQSCHEEGGYTEDFDAYAPVTPHLRDEMQNCRQCHQPQKTENTFRNTDWKTVTPPGNKRTGLSSAPPNIPHDLQYRSACLTCHSGPGAVNSLRTDHPERSNCRQCHQPESTESVWERGE